MRHRHVVAVHRVAVRCFLIGHLRRLVDHQLVAEEVEIHPVRTAATLRAAEHLAIKMPGCSQVVDGNSQVKGCKSHAEIP